MRNLLLKHRLVPGVTVMVALLFSATISAQRVKKTVFVIADGIPADMIEKLHPPHLQSIIEKGAYRRLYVGGVPGSYNQTPTISAPGYNDLLTGTWGNKHNVLDNDIKAPDYAYHTIFRFFKEAYPDKKTGIFSSWQDNRTKLVGDKLAATGNITVDYSADGYELDKVTLPHDKESAYMHLIDEKVIGAADSVIREKGPDLSWIYLEYTDDMGHRYGTGSPKYEEAISFLDVQMGKIYEAIRYRESHFAEDWQFILTTDHGRDSVTGRNHGYQSMRERTTWTITNLAAENDYFKKMNPAIVDILPTIASWLSIPVPDANRYELDGTSWLGRVSVTGGRGEIKGDSLVLTWKALETGGKLQFLISTGNGFKTGAIDNYLKAGETGLTDERFAVPLSALPASGFYKIVFLGQDNAVNWWVKKP